MIKHFVGIPNMTIPACDTLLGPTQSVSNVILLLAVFCCVGLAGFIPLSHS